MLSTNFNWILQNENILGDRGWFTRTTERKSREIWAEPALLILSAFFACQYKPEEELQARPVWVNIPVFADNVSNAATFKCWSMREARQSSPLQTTSWKYQGSDQSWIRFTRLVSVVHGCRIVVTWASWDQILCGSELMGAAIWHMRYFRMYV